MYVVHILPFEHFPGHIFWATGKVMKKLDMLIVILNMGYKMFNQSSQLQLGGQIHYINRPFLLGTSHQQQDNALWFPTA